MKAYIRTDRNDWSLRRVMDALRRYAPDDIEIVEYRNDADLVVLHVIGRQDRTMRKAQLLLENGQQYAAIQYCVRNTLRPHTSTWLPLWRDATLVWSYYNLEAWCAADWTPFDFSFYHAPLGVDSEMFYPRKQRRRFIIGTSGPSAVTESVREAAFATKRVGGEMFHLGPELHRGPDIVCQQGMDDDTLANTLSQCNFVAGLRRTEGLELMAAEGLLCGARPICFDRNHYRQWYAQWAVFIPEGSRDGVIDNLESIFREGPRPVTDEERKAAADLFNWQRVVTGFWDNCLKCSQ